jgi:hypothetical protein
MNRQPPIPEQEPVHSPTPAGAEPNETSERNTPTATGLPISAVPTPTIPSPQRESFWQFFLHHVRTDPQARLCKQAFWYIIIQLRILFCVRDVNVVLPRDNVSRRYGPVFAVIFNDGGVFLVLVASDY